MEQVGGTSSPCRTGTGISKAKGNCVGVVELRSGRLGLLSIRRDRTVFVMASRIVVARGDVTSPVLNVAEI